jgi:lysine 2,3-aminomutase
MTWVTKLSADKLFRAGVTVRCQTPLLRGVNDSVEVMGELITKLAENNIVPYYVFQGDMVKGVEDLRTPLSTILHIEEQLRGFIGGFMFPQFAVDLPGGGGKRLANSYISYDEKTGISRFRAPGVKSGKIFEYHDPIWSIGQLKLGEKAFRT